MDITKKVVIIIAGTNNQPWDQNWKECERTWAPKLREMGFKVLVAVGNPDIDKAGTITPLQLKNYWQIEGNIIRFNTFEGKNDLYNKSIGFPAKWVLEETDYEYYIKIDSDTFVHPERFKTMLESNLKDFPDLDYMGCCIPWMGWNTHQWNRSVICREGAYASGAAYMVSRRAMQILLDRVKFQQASDFIYDDLVLGRTMWQNRIPLLHDSRIMFDSKWKRIIYDPHNFGLPNISDKDSHVAIQHYMDKRMDEAMQTLGL